MHRFRNESDGRAAGEDTEEDLRVPVRRTE